MDRPPPVIDTGNFYLTGRAGGKTSAMVKWAVDNDGLIVCFNSAEAKRVTALIKRENLHRWQCARTHHPGLSRGADRGRAESFQSQNLRGQRRPVAIDNAEIILQQLVGGSNPIEKITASI